MAKRKRRPRSQPLAAETTALWRFVRAIYRNWYRNNPDQCDGPEDVLGFLAVALVAAVREYTLPGYREDAALSIHAEVLSLVRALRLMEVTQLMSQRPAVPVRLGRIRERWWALEDL